MLKATTRPDLASLQKVSRCETCLSSRQHEKPIGLDEAQSTSKFCASSRSYCTISLPYASYECRAWQSHILLKAISAVCVRTEMMGSLTTGCSLQKSSRAEG